MTSSSALTGRSRATSSISSDSATPSDLSVLVRRAGAPLPRVVRVDKGPGEPLGVEVSSAVFDRIRTCDNHCAFCFIYQLPKGMRRSLYLKDDDYRLSFLYGNFTTLTRFTELDAERILTERLGPLFVSIHTTDPELRAHMLRNPKGATSLRWLEVLLDGGIEVHGQIVVCPGVNDGAALEDTLAGILDRTRGWPASGRSRSGSAATPTRPRCAPTRPRRPSSVLDTIERVAAPLQEGAGPSHGLRGRRVLPAGRARPSRRPAATTGYPQHENGIGMARAFAEAFARPAAGGPGGVRHGFFASVDAAPAEGYRAPRLPTVPAGRRRPARHDPDRHLRRPGARPRWWPRTRGRTSRCMPSTNDFFGGNIGVAGLLTGEDLARALERRARRARAACCPTPASTRGASSTG